MTKNRFQSFMGTLNPDLRAVNMSDWGMPTVDETSTIQPGEEFVHRGGKQQWAPGEFEEWKQGHITGLGTNYGRNAQRAYKMRHFPGLLDMINQGAANANRVEAGDVGPNSQYFQDLLNRFRR
jgi:broad specificity phosphatase PhoE